LLDSLLQERMVCPLPYIPLLSLLLLLPLLIVLTEASSSPCQLSLSPGVACGKGRFCLGQEKEERLREETTQEFKVTAINCEGRTLHLTNQKPHIALLSAGEDEQEEDERGERAGLQLSLPSSSASATFVVNITGTFLGFTTIEIALEGGKEETSVMLDLTVTRSKAKKTASKIFGYSVAVLVSLAYINFGCALDLNVMREVLRKPIGPAIGFVSQFIFMPLCSFALGFVFDNPEMRLGLFFTGTSPGGGASNIWTIMFGGNLDLSVTMTAVSTFSAFFMMPLWVFLLGEVIVAGTHISDIPYFTITKYAVLLVVPLLIGISIRKCLPKAANFMVRFMKPLALFLIVFILVCGIWSQFFMLKLITWRTALVGFALPWLGFGFGCLLSKFCNRERKDIIAIAIETGIQNTGMSIFMLWHSLDHPAGDLAAVVPVAVATLTPVPLLAALAYYRARASYCPLPRGEKEVDTEELQEKQDKTGEDVEEKNEIKMTQEKEIV